MDKRKNVMKGLECCSQGAKEPYVPTIRHCAECPYLKSEIPCTRALARDALELLEAQEAIKPYIDYDGQDVWRCGKCGNSLMHPSYNESDEDAKNYIRYCSHCGKAVKWDG